MGIEFVRDVVAETAEHIIGEVDLDDDNAGITQFLCGRFVTVAAGTLGAVVFILRLIQSAVCQRYDRMDILIRNLILGSAAVRNAKLLSGFAAPFGNGILKALGKGIPSFLISFAEDYKLVASGAEAGTDGGKSGDYALGCSA